MAVNKRQMNVLAAKSAGDLGAAVCLRMAVIGENPRLYKALAKGPLKAAKLGQPV